MVAAGIIDPTKVVRVALQDAASIAGLLITTEAMIGDRPEPKGAPGMPPGGMRREYGKPEVRAVEPFDPGRQHIAVKAQR